MNFVAKICDFFIIIITIILDIPCHIHYTKKRIVMCTLNILYTFNAIYCIPL